MFILYLIQLFYSCSIGRTHFNRLYVLIITIIHRQKQDGFYFVQFKRIALNAYACGYVCVNKPMFERVHVVCVCVCEGYVVDV